MSRGAPIVTAKEYRELSVEFYKWADAAETEEMRDTYLRLAGKRTIAALSASCLPATTRATSSGGAWVKSLSNYQLR
jgi:hypothetical protein